MATRFLLFSVLAWELKHVICNSQLLADHIRPGNPLAEVGVDALRFSFSPVVEMNSWKTPSLQIEKIIYKVRSPGGIFPELNLNVRTEDVNITKPNCSLTGTFVRCTSVGGTLIGSVSKFARDCVGATNAPPIWRKAPAIIFSLQSIGFRRKPPTLTYQCSSDKPLFNFTLSRIGCPLGFWGRNCTANCSCPSHQDCHTFTGDCVVRINIPTTSSSTVPTANDRHVTTVSDLTNTDVNDTPSWVSHLNTSAPGSPRHVTGTPTNETTKASQSTLPRPLIFTTLLAIVLSIIHLPA